MSLPHSTSLSMNQEAETFQTPSRPRVRLDGLLPVLRSSAWLIILCAVLAASVVGFRSGARPKLYTSSAAFVPQTKPSFSALAGLASQLGVSAPAGEADQSSQFYVELLRSRTVLWAVATANYSRGSETGTLLKLYGVSNRPPFEQQDAIIHRLNAEISSTLSRQTGVILLRVTSPDPSISQQIAQHVIEQVNVFNARTRQTQAVQERTFSEARLTQMRGELQSAENRLQFFLQGNRDFRTSPKLSFEADRLGREVAEKQEVVTSLAQLYERSRMEEVRERSLITVIDAPSRPSRANPRGIVKELAVALLMGAIFGAAGPAAAHRRDWVA